jgi:hypothetical protein
MQVTAKQVEDVTELEATWQFTLFSEICFLTQKNP